MRLIDADELRSKIYLEQIKLLSEGKKERASVYQDFFNHLNDITVIDPVIRTKAVILHEIGMLQCKNCGQKMMGFLEPVSENESGMLEFTTRAPKYCEGCGAKIMEVEVDESVD